MMKKRLISMILCISVITGILCGMSVGAFAAGEDDLIIDESQYITGTPDPRRYDYINDIIISTYVENGEFIAAGSVSTDSDVTKIVIFAYAQRKDGDKWVTIATQDFFFYNTWYAPFEISCNDASKVLRYHDYQLFLSIYAYKGDVYSHKGAYGNIKYYG